MDVFTDEDRENAEDRMRQEAGTVTINLSDLDALIERKMAEKEAAARAPKRGRTTGCNCALEGYTDRSLHQFGCPWADPKGDLSRKRVEDIFDR